MKQVILNLEQDTGTLINQTRMIAQETKSCIVKKY